MGAFMLKKCNRLHSGVKNMTKAKLGVYCIINTKLPSCVDIIRRTSLVFHSLCPESTRPTDSCFQGTICENLMMYGGLYQHTRVVLYMYQTFRIDNIIKVLKYNFNMPLRVDLGPLF